MDSLTSNLSSSQTKHGFIYVVSSETKEITQYKISHFGTTFKGVIDDLKKLGKPSKLFYYNGDMTQILPTDKISSYLPTRRSQVVFWASSGQLMFPLVGHKKGNILVLMISSDYEMLSFFVPGSTDINQLTSNYGSLDRIANGNRTKITSGTISENLPIRSNQIIFLLKLSLDKNINLVNDYRLGKRLGKGGFGTVYLAKDLKKGFGNVAIKLIPTFDRVNMSNKVALNSELSAWKKISAYPISTCNKYIVCLYDFGTGSYKGKPYFVLIMEYIGNSMELLDYSRKFKMKTHIVEHILNDLVIGLREIHKLGVYHKDIKNQNVLISLSDDNSKITHVKYIDFGLSCIFGKNKNEKCDMQSGTPTYVSAELIYKTSPFTKDELKAIDIYALGVTMYTMFNKHPYNKAVLRAQKRNDYQILYRALKTDHIEPLLTADIEADGWFDTIKRYYLATTITSLVNPDMKKRLEAFDAIKTQDMLSSSRSISSSRPQPKVLKPFKNMFIIREDYEQNSQKRLSSKPSSRVSDKQNSQKRLSSKPSSWVMMPDYTQN